MRGLNAIPEALNRQDETYMTETSAIAYAAWFDMLVSSKGGHPGDLSPLFLTSKQERVTMDNRDAIPFLVKQEVIFICEKCGDTVTMIVPHPNNSNECSYCCKATYRVSTDLDGEVFIIRT